MRRMLYLLVVMLATGGVGAFAQTDSVKVRLQTSNGAEISLNGELSSTNILTKKVPVGKHKVVVNYGLNYSRTYEINVEKGGKADFEFLVEGSLALSSTPKNADVYIDGLPQGKTPINVNLLGRHNIQVVGNKDIYHPYTTTLEVLPEQIVEHNAILVKRPPKLYGFIIANYMISANAPGIMAGIGRRFGGYIKMNTGVNGEPHDYTPSTRNETITSEGYEKKPKYFGVNAGLTLHALPCLFVYAGSGYGKYSHGVYSFSNGDQSDVYNVKGAEVDFGIMLKYKALLLQAGYTRILATGDNGKFGEFNVGIGITIHKEKKR